tara:strand:- start:147 stop:482 length:336 start_codon:yes stop_codon:yes gene_type:complete
MLSKGTPILSFRAMKSGKEWEASEGRKHLIVEEGEGSSYNLYLIPIDEQEGQEEQEWEEGEGITHKDAVKEGYNTIKILLPSLIALYEIIDILYSKSPRFSTLSEISESCC